jgi:iron uptake system component EfeO
MEFTGFHRLEKDLWVTGDLSRSGPVADRLLADVKDIVDKANAEKLSPLNLANGAKELLDEVATGKITGEEDRYSHTDLWDFSANLDGTKAAIAALRPVLAERAPDLVAAIDREFANVDVTLGKHRVGDGWKSHNELTQAELKELSDAINALAEPVSKVAVVVAK